MNPGILVILAGLTVFAFVGLAFTSATPATSTSTPPARTASSTSTPGGTVSAQGSYGADIVAAGKRWGVPTWILWGVFGMETAHGSNVNTSSAGAIGLMQFIPSTAQQYNYPQTNSPNAQQAAQQFDSAAHLLHDLFHQTGSWDAALHSYSGGGYGLPEVQGQSAGHP